MIDDGITVQLNSKRLGEINNSSPPPFIHQGFQGPTNAMHSFVQGATCGNKHIYYTAGFASGQDEPNRAL